MGYYRRDVTTLTRTTDRGGRQCQVGSLTGAVASQKVTEAPKVHSRPVWKSFAECKSTSKNDCETDRSSRDEKSGLVIRWFRMEGPSLNG